MSNSQGLLARRSALAERWERFAGGQNVGDVRTEVLSSWRRMRARGGAQVSAAPCGVGGAVDSGVLVKSIEALSDVTRSTLREAGIVAALAGVDGQIVWTTGDPALLRRAESINYAPGALWDEASMGITAMSLSLCTNAPSTVWSAEHWSAILHDWSCHAAPVRDPHTGRQFGVLNFSTPWDNGHPATTVAVAALADRLADAVVAATGTVPAASGDIELTVLGERALTVCGQAVRLTKRQTEIALLLALRPDGVSLAELHADLYGDDPVEPATLKAEVSHLRRLLTGRVSRAPYRLTGSVSVDVCRVLEDLRAGRLAEAVRRYRGPLLPWSESPRIVRLARTVEVAIRDAVLASRDVDAAWALSAHFEDDLQLADHLLDILPAEDCRRHLVHGQILQLR